MIDYDWIKMPKPRRYLKLTAPPAPLERDEQVAYMKWLYHECPKYRGERMWRFAFMIANGGYRHVGSREQRGLTGKAMERQGLKPGVPDIEIVIAMPPWHGMFIEMKRIGAPKPNDDQIAWHALLRDQGYFVAVCYGLAEAQAATLEYFGVIG